jgi:folate/biopterin transporter
VKYIVYQPPENPTWVDKLLHMPRSLVHFVHNLSTAFGPKFVFVVFAIYGLQQGLGSAYFFQARDYYFKDVAELSPGEAQIFTSSSMVPWNIKPLYGMWADTMSVMGFHRTPVLILSGLIGSLCLFLLSVALVSATVAVVFMFGVNYSIASPDVMVDASVAEKVAKHPEFGSDLQALCWGSMAFGSIIGYGTSGILIQALGPAPVFGILIVFSLIVLACGSMGWFGELRTHEKPTKTYCRVVDWYSHYYSEHKSIFNLAVVLSSMALFVAVAVIIITDWYARFAVILVVGTAVPSYFYYDNVKHGHKEVAKCGLFLFLTTATTPEISTTMFYWYTDAEGGPNFTPIFVGIIQMCSYIAMIAGIALYNNYMTKWQFRSIFTSAQLLLVACGMLDIILVSRANTKVGIPDEAFAIISDSTLSAMMNRLLYIPMFVLAARVCPPGAEATLFAMFMSLINFGSSVAIYFGSFWVFVLGITDTNYDNFVYLIIIRSVARLIPIPIIYMLVPPGTPSDSEDGRASDGAVKPAISNTHAINARKHSDEGRMSFQLTSRSSTGNEKLVEGIMPSDAPAHSMNRSETGGHGDTSAESYVPPFVPSSPDAFPEDNYTDRIKHSAVFHVTDQRIK